MKPYALRRLFAFLACAIVVAACSITGARRELPPQEAYADPEQALLDLRQEMARRPEDAALRSRYFRQRELAIAGWLQEAEAAILAGRREEALDRIERVGRNDPANPRGAALRQAIFRSERHAAILADARNREKRGETMAARSLYRAVLAEDASRNDVRSELDRLDAAIPAQPVLGERFRKPISLKLRDAPLATLLVALSGATGLNFVLDREVPQDLRVTVAVKDAAVDDVLRVVLLANQLEKRVVSPSTILVFPNTPQKTREYQPLVTRSFHLANADARQLQGLLKSVLKSRDYYIDERLNALVVKDTPDAIRLAERLIEGLDVAEAEVMLEVEVLEVSRNKLAELGLRFPDQAGFGLLQGAPLANGGTAPGGTLAPGFADLRRMGALTWFAPNALLLLNLRNDDNAGNLLANPRIRVKNREKARIHIGEKLPVFTTTSTANVGVSASVSYLDVGLKLDVEPTVHTDSEVGIKVGLEVSSVVREVLGPQQSLAYQIGTRSTATQLRLQNGETQILAGLISDEERKSVNKIPGLGDLPLLGRLFSNQRETGTKTEIILLITPRIIRPPVRPAADALELAAGTEGQVGLGDPIALRGSTPGGVRMSSSGGSGLPPAIVQDAAAGAAPAAAASGVALRGPQAVAMGEEFLVEVELSGGGELRQASAFLVFDPGRMEAVAPLAVAPGRIPVTLTAPAGGGAVARLRLRAVGGSGTATLHLDDVGVTDQGGTPQAVSPTAELKIQVGA
ncbi:MAG: secretin N-terminal domain-containing protein [Azonexus sp.]